MKSKIRKTGEIVDIICYNGTTYRQPGDMVSYIDSKGIEHEDEHLNYYWDFKLVEEPTDNTDWQALRHQYAGMGMLGVMNFFGSLDYNRETIAKLAVEQADALIEELKKK